MDIILIPGLWLDASSWQQVASVLEESGHRPRAVTLPGMESIDADRSDISLRQAVAAVVAEVDSSEGSVVLVAHSAGGGIAHAVVDARPDRVARVIYVGGFPTPSGHAIAGGFAVEEGEMRLPAWDQFDDADLTDLDEDRLREFRNRAIPSPGRFATDEQVLGDDRRHDVPVTLVCTEFSSEELQRWVEAELDPVAEIGLIRHVEYVDIPTGHWPQMTRPSELAMAIAERAFQPHIDEHQRIHPEGEVGEVLLALGFLDYQRATLAWKTRGVDRAGLAARTADSSLTLGGILKHMALVEESWFSAGLHGREYGPPWDEVDWAATPDWDFDSAADDDPDDLRRMWNTACARSRALVASTLASGGFDTPAVRTGPEGERVSLRWIVLHMIEEYARHNGHADLLRESVDGEVGE